VFPEEKDNLTSKTKHIHTRNHLKELGESKKGIMVYESAPVQAGIRTVYHDEHAVPDYVLNIPQFKDCNYGTRASGDSMYPEIRNGDLIVCKELPLDARIIFGDIYVVHTKDGIETIKYIQQFVDGPEEDPWVLLVPHNKAAGMGTPIPRKEIVKLFKVRAIFKAY
jgi:phage repressor protein C with HTH and peptisase S24 domain